MRQYHQAGENQDESHNIHAKQQQSGTAGQADWPHLSGIFRPAHKPVVGVVFILPVPALDPGEKFAQGQRGKHDDRGQGRLGHAESAYGRKARQDRSQWVWRDNGSGGEDVQPEQLEKKADAKTLRPIPRNKAPGEAKGQGAVKRGKIYEEAE